MKKMYQKTSFGQKNKLELVFVSVDPDRDTDEKMKKFLSFFDNQFIGITGKSNKDQALVEMLKKFKIYSTKIEFEE